VAEPTARARWGLQQEVWVLQQEVWVRAQVLVLVRPAPLLLVAAGRRVRGVGAPDVVAQCVAVQGVGAPDERRRAVAARVVVAASWSKPHSSVLRQAFLRVRRRRWARVEALHGRLYVERGRRVLPPSRRKHS